MTLMGTPSNGLVRAVTAAVAGLVTAGIGLLKLSSRLAQVLGCALAIMGGLAVLALVILAVYTVALRARSHHQASQALIARFAADDDPTRVGELLVELHRPDRPA